MIDRDRVISRLQIIRTWAEVGKSYDGIQGEKCLKDVVDWIDDALELLKEQEPRVLTLDETKRLWRGTAKILVERRDRPTIEEYSPGWMITHFTMLLTDNSWLNGQTYNKYWRCWSARPTDEQRKAVKWDD